MSTSFTLFVFTILSNLCFFRARLFNFESLTSLKNLKARTYGKFIAIKGTLVKVLKSLQE